MTGSGTIDHENWNYKNLWNPDFALKKKKDQPYGIVASNRIQSEMKFSLLN